MDPVQGIKFIFKDKNWAIPTGALQIWNFVHFSISECLSNDFGFQLSNEMNKDYV